MMNSTHAERVRALHNMNRIIVDELGDEDILYDWYAFGVPDEPSNEDISYIASDIELFNEIEGLFDAIYKENRMFISLRNMEPDLIEFCISKDTELGVLVK